MEFKNPYFSKLNKIELLQKWIIIHSILYYHLDSSTVSDAMFDNNCQQLKKLMLKSKSELKQSKYYKIFKGFEKSATNSCYNLLNDAEIKKHLQLCHSVIRLANK